MLGSNVAYISRHGSTIYVTLGRVVRYREHESYGVTEEQIGLRLYRDKYGEIDRQSSWIFPRNCLVINDGV